ncbi:helix-turn-helix domain-containing protein [Clostridium botulinum]|uniref:helix-turn-helix domain-containing protein n=1 Tax=Clostridium botulinum TaxID=1491 RepID=UPI0004D632B0|nr:XRE family transcriptional regulator [Clostridium botulinum]KEI00924.1 DNA-binding protein [Clostridium botulinum C/D str. BKT75002]KEI11090.1 DNA-binding protein [Clostridium botulinum C/D str. BKT2873]QPW61364.1 helix-turn-helix transcriptional regulator [Clostridium botulinum]
MKELTSIIGTNLRTIRNKKNMTLDNVSKLTGVSKAMLGQIERGESNPTVSTLWKISTGLKVSFSSFIDDSNENLKIIYQDKIDPIIEDSSRMKLYPIFPFDAKKNFEVFTVELEPNCNHISSPHDYGVEEYIIVTEGALKLTINDKIFMLNKGHSISFKGNNQHSYENTSKSKSIFQNIMLYSK